MVGESGSGTLEDPLKDDLTRDFVFCCFPSGYGFTPGFLLRDVAEQAGYWLFSESDVLNIKPDAYGEVVPAENWREFKCVIGGFS